MLNIIECGTGLKSADDFRQALRNTDCKFGDRSHYLMNQTACRVADKLTKVRLDALEVAELGFESGAKYFAICQRVLRIGYDLCQFEHGLQLRLQYKDQPKGEKLFMAMEAIRYSSGNLFTFVVGHHDDGLWLGARHAGPDNFFDAGCKIVCVCRN